MGAPHNFLYLSRADVESIGLPMRTVVEAVELALREKAAGRTIMPPKHWIAPSTRRFFSAMSSALPGLRAAGCKWQSGSPDNHALGQPYITGQFILNALDTGLPIAIMDSTWITEMRTAAATAVAARALVGKPSQVLGVLGCGLQARRNLEALRLVFPSLASVRAYDVSAAAAETYRNEMKARHGVEVTLCPDPRAAFDGADIVLTCGPIAPDGPRVAEAAWLEEGATAITLDYDCYWKPDELARVDRLFTDDVAQLEHTKTDGYFTSVPGTIQELASVVAGREAGRTSRAQRVVCINMGIALEDVTTALSVYRQARDIGRGVELPI
jgi:ornithine cyclodeaminase/alanine dehydrogenase-like protein (mu-crystallin family)